MLMIVLLFMALSLSIFAIMTYLLPADRKAKVEAIPQDLASWQLTSMRDVFMDEKIAPKDMGKYTFGWLRNGEMVGYRKPGAGDVSLSLFLAALSRDARFCPFCLTHLANRVVIGSRISKTMFASLTPTGMPRVYALSQPRFKHAPGQRRHYCNRIQSL